MTTQELINTLKQGKPMTDRLMREIVRELEEKTEQVCTMGTAMRAKDADYVSLRVRAKRLEGVIRMLIGCIEDFGFVGEFEEELEAARKALEE
jgi:hypothetical protein